MMNQSVIFGTITAADEHKNMTVELENGEKGIVTLAEVTRRNLAESYPAELLIGRRLGFMAGELNADGLRELSARRYEDWLFEEIKASFERRVRNVYPVELVSVTPGVAYYRLAQGVNGGVTLGDFAFAYTSDFTSPNMHLPRTGAAVIKQITDSGRIDLIMRPAVGDFSQNIDRLGLTEGCEIEAPVVSMTRDKRSSIAMLAPNLTVLSGNVPVGDMVRLRCLSINRETRRLRVEVISSYPCAPRAFDYDAFMLTADELGDYVDPAEFETRMRPTGAAVAAPKQVEVDFRIPPNVFVSPFCVEEGETAVHERRPFSRSQLVRDIETGALDERHRNVCRAVCDLRYSNQFLIQRYLSAKMGVDLSVPVLKNILTRLVEHNILAVMNFHRDAGGKSVPVYVCGGQYRNFMSAYPRIQAWEYSNTDASIPKTRLCSNQLLIGLLHSRSVTGHDPHPYILLNGGTPEEIRVRPRHRLTVDGQLCYLEGVRSNWEFEAFAGKLMRYQQAFDITGENAEVLVAVESREIAQELAARVENELALGYTVRFCADLDALPEPQFFTAQPTRAAKAEKVVELGESEAPAGFLGKLKLRIFGKAA